MKSTPLGTYTKLASTRERKYRLQAVAGRLLPGERVAWCSRRVTSQVEIHKQGERCYYRGLAKCGSGWICPVCGAKISEARRQELKQAAASGCSTILLTLTLQHNRRDPLEEVLGALLSASRRLRSGRKYQALEARYSIVASASALEFTYSQEHGWHAHRHILLFSQKAQSEINIQALEAELSERWCAMLAKQGKYGSEFYALKAQLGEEASAGYIAKWGAAEELTKSQSKQVQGGSYSVWQLLEQAEQGELWAVAAFREYAHCVKGKHALTWSKGARQLFNLGEEKSDQELAKEEEPAAELVHRLSREEWILVCEQERRAELLEVAERQGSPGVSEYLHKLREREKVKI